MDRSATASRSSLSPRVRVEGERLIARTSLATRALMLFYGGRRVIVDRRSRYVFVHTRFLWFLFRKRAIPFRRVRHIEYRYGGALTPWEMFLVQLALQGPDEIVDLLTFAGDDPSSVGVTELLVGSVGGDQQRASLGYVELLARFLGVPIGPSIGPRL